MTIEQRVAVLEEIFAKLQDYYMSDYSGEEIDERLTAAHNAVRYDAAQTLTDAQKTQARNNISAMQGIESTDHPGCNYVLNGSTVEWINPPFAGDEYTAYTTTEKRNGGVSVSKATIGDFEVWNAGDTTGHSSIFWPSLGKSVRYTVNAGGTKNIALPHDHTFFFSSSDNVRQGVAIVQTSGGAVQSVTALVPLGNWKIEIGTDLSVNVTELGGQYELAVYVMMV